MRNIQCLTELICIKLSNKINRGEKVYMKWSKKGKEYEKIKDFVIDNNVDVYIWGAGTFGKSIYELFKSKIRIKGYIDSDPEKQSLSSTVKIYLPEFFYHNLLKENTKIIVASGWIAEIYKQLEIWGMRENKNYFHANEFIPLYMLYKENKVYAVSLNIPITTYCTLRCEKCMALIPYVKKPENRSLQELKEELQTYFQWVDSLTILGLGGGDVLRHSHLAEILTWIGETYYGKKVQDIEIYTNAIIMPSEELLQLFEKYNVIVRFSDYSQTIPGRQKMDVLIDMLEKRGIRYERCVWDTWYDIGFPQQTNGLTEDQKLIDHYNNCITKLCAIEYKKKLYFCSVHASAVIAGYCIEDNKDCFDLSLYSEERKSEFIEFNAGYCEKGYLSYCKRCNGYQNINDKYVPVAKQLQMGKI